MNGQRPKISRVLIAVAVVIGGASGLGACSTSLSPSAEPMSERVEALVEAHRTYPRWEDFPPAPTDVPAPAEVAGRVTGLRDVASALDARVAALERLQTDPEGFAARTRARVDNARPSLAAARTAAEIETYARSLRDRAEPPPPLEPR